MSNNEETIPVQDEAIEDSNVDAEAKDQQADSKQLQSEASDLDESIDDSPSVTTRGAKVDALQQEREIDQAVEDAEQDNQEA